MGLAKCHFYIIIMCIIIRPKMYVKIILEQTCAPPKAKYDGKLTIFSIVCKIAGISPF